VPTTRPSTALSWQSSTISTNPILSLVSSSVYAHGFGATFFVNFLGEYSVSISGLILSSMWLRVPQSPSFFARTIQNTFYKYFANLFDVG
jgi:hypothetical protein